MKTSSGQSTEENKVYFNSWIFTEEPDRDLYEKDWLFGGGYKALSRSPQMKAGQLFPQW